MGSKGRTTITPQLPNELSGLYRQTAANIMEGQGVLPLFGGAGTGTAAPRPAGRPPNEEPNQAQPRKRRIL